MSKNRKKIVRLRESEMIDLIERIVTEVKKEKKTSIQENTHKRRAPRRKPVSRKR
tara:strand:- start:1575 stop:1739 length:165 start_codon:yes stop_codon:yes gene_type:complete